MIGVGIHFSRKNIVQYAKIVIFAGSTTDGKSGWVITYIFVRIN